MRKAESSPADTYAFHVLGQLRNGVAIVQGRGIRILTA